MVRPNFIPRTLQGVGGKRYFNIPGVIYPKEVIQTRPGLSPENGKPYDVIPPWGITTDQAADILGCSHSAARIMMRRKRITFRLVAQDGRPPRIYWKKDRVEKIANEKEPLVQKDEIAGLLTTMEAAKALNVGRSTIQRAIKSGKLKPVFLRCQSGQGPRRRCYLRVSDINKLRNHRMARIARANALNIFADDGDD